MFFVLFVCFDMNAMCCILKGLALYNFGNKFVFIFIFIVRLQATISMNLLMNYRHGLSITDTEDTEWSY